MNLSPDQIEIGSENFMAAIGSKLVRREFLQEAVRKGVASKHGLGAYYFGYGKSVPEPVRVGVIGTGDEGSVLIGALNPEFVQVKAIADIRPYSIYRAFHGDHYSDEALKNRPGLLAIYTEWKTKDDAQRQGKVKIYGDYRDLIANAAKDGIEAVIIALPLHLHAPAAVAAMRAGLHVITEKLMGHTVHECKEMARVATQTKRLLATGHQRHYSILYNNAVELVSKRLLGDVHFIQAQWNRDDRPGHDSWKQPLPPGVKTLTEDPAADALLEELKKLREELAKQEDAKKPDLKEIERINARIPQKEAQISDKLVKAEKFGYLEKSLTDASGKPIYRRPAIEELIRWRLWDRTGAGLMAELGSHQLDAASIFVAAMFGGKKQHPLSVSAAGNRPLFPADRECEDHVYCVLEFPAPGYDPKDTEAAKRKVGVQYASINGNGFGGYGETVLGTEGTLIVEREKQAMLYKVAPDIKKTKVVPGKKEGDKQGPPDLDFDPEGDEASAALGRMAMLEAGRGYAEELEHWAWCIRNRAPENLPRCHPKVAIVDAVIALTANRAARRGERIEFNEAWFDPDRDETPEGEKPDLSRYGK